jgi:hypothetical protein
VTEVITNSGRMFGGDDPSPTGRRGIRLGGLGTIGSIGSAGSGVGVPGGETSYRSS